MHPTLVKSENLPLITYIFCLFEVCCVLSSLKLSLMHQVPGMFLHNIFFEIHNCSVTVIGLRDLKKGCPIEFLELNTINLVCEKACGWSEVYRE